jgi:hypothetical protein
MINNGAKIKRFIYLKMVRNCIKAVKTGNFICALT